MAKQLNVNLAFTADTGKAKAQLQDLNRQLDNLIGGKGVKNIDLGITKEINEGIAAAASLKAHLQDATNVNTGKLDLTKFTQSLQKSGKTLDDYAKNLQKLGPQGSEAFLSLARSISNAEVPLVRVNKKLEEMWTTLKNTARWQISSSILHGFMGSVQSAFGYAEDLNESLNNIRIVTGQNVDQMAQFAKEANKAAKALSTTTTEYTNASLIYYQQGLSEEEVLERADVTVKMANVANQSAEVVSDQMTAVWNNFYDGSKSLEYYADVMTALGAATASSTDEIAGGLEKFAAIADTIGLSYEYAASALATITSNTRQSEEVVGTALKTIFARIQGLNLGETLEDGVTLNKYSEALSKVGISIFEQNGELKAMDNILNEMGDKWDTLNKAQQTALAQTVAGVRQYNQLISLMDNWDKGDSDSFQANLKTVEKAEGALDEQADIYAESWEAASDRVRAAAEAIYSNLINDEFFIDLLDFGADALTTIDKIMDSLGGMPGILSVISAIILKTFRGKIVDEIEGMTNALVSLTDMEGAKMKSQATKKEAYKKAAELATKGTDKSDPLSYGNVRAKHIQDEAMLQDILLDKSNQLNELQLKEFQTRLDGLRVMQEEAELQAKTVEKEKEKTEELVRRQKLLVIKSDLGDQDKKDTITAINNYEKMHKGLGAFDKMTYQAAKGNKTYTEDDIKRIIDISGDALNDNIKTSLNALIGKTASEVVDDVLDIYIEIEEQAGKVAQSLIDTEGINLEQKNLDEIAKSAQKTGAEINDLTNKTNNLGQMAKDIEGDLNSASASTITWRDTLVQSAEGIVSITGGIIALKGAFNSLSEAMEDGNLSMDEFIGFCTSLSIALPSLISGVKALGAVQTANTAGTLAATVAQTKLGAAVTAVAAKFGIALGPIGAFVAILAGVAIATAGLIKIIDDNIITQEEAQESIKKANEAYTEQKQIVDDLNNTLQTTKEKIDELNNKDTLSLVEQDELNMLKQELAYLERQLEIEKALEKERQEKQVDEIVNKYSKANESLIEGPEKIVKKRNIGEGDGMWEYQSADEWWGDRTEAQKQNPIYKEEYNKWLDEEKQAKTDWLNENKEFIQNAEKDYQSVITAINAGIEVNPEAIKNLQSTLRFIRQNTLENGKYFELVIEPVFDSKAFNQQKNDIVKELNKKGTLKEFNFNEDLKDQLELAGISINEFSTQIRNLYRNANNILKDVQGTPEDFINSLSFEDIQLINESNFDTTEFEEFYRKFLELKNQRNSIVINVQMARDTAKDALNTLASGDFLSEEQLTNLQEHFKDLYDLSNLVNMSMYDQARTISSALLNATIPEAAINNTINKVGELQEQLNTLNETESELTDEEKLLKIELEAELDQAKKDIEALTSEPINLSVEIDNSLIEGLKAQAGAIDKATSLITEGFKVEAKNVSELMKTMPQLFEDATVDIKTGVVQLQQDIVNSTIETAKAETEIERQGLIERLNARIIYLNGSIDSLNKLRTVAEANSDATKLKEEINSKLTLDEKKASAAAIVKAKIQQAIQEQTQSAKAASHAIQDQQHVTDASKIESETLYQNWQDALEEFNQAAYSAFSNAQAYQTAFTNNEPVGRLSLNAKSSITGRSSSSTYQWDYNDGQENKYSNLQAFVDAGFDFSKIEGLDQSNDIAVQVYANQIQEQWKDLFNTDLNGKALWGGTEGFTDQFFGMYETAEALGIDTNLSINDLQYELAEAIAQLSDTSSFNGALEELKKVGASKNGKDYKPEIERYHEINREIDNQQKLLDELGKKKDKAFGPEKIAFIEREIIELEKLKQKQEELLSQQKKDLLIDQAAVKALFPEAKIGEGGEISNFNELMLKTTNEEQAKILEQYEKTLDAIETTKIAIMDLDDEIQNTSLEKITTEVDFEVEIKQRDLDKLDYIIDKLGRNVNQMVEAIDKMGTKVGLYENQSEFYRNGIKQIYQNATGRELTDDEQRQIWEYEDALLDLNNSLMDLVETVENSLLEEFERLSSEIDDNINRFDTYSGAVDHYTSIIKLSGRQTKDSMLLMELSAQKTDIAMKKLNSTNDKYLAQQKTQTDVKSNLEKALKSKNQADIDYWKKQYDEITKMVEESHDEMLGSWEEVLQAASDQFDQAIELTIQKLKDAISEYGLDGLADRYEKAKTVNEQYLSQLDKEYELNKLIRQMEKSVDETDNIKAKQILNDLLDQANEKMAENVQLSQYDLEYMQKQYDLELARIALEEAQNAKSVVRLSRDNEGNFGYVYTADQDQVDDAQQNYEDKLAETRNLSEEYIQEMSDLIIQNEQDLMDALASIDKTRFETKEEYEAEVERITKYYLDRDIYLRTELDKAVQNSGKVYSDTILGQLENASKWDEAHNNLKTNTNEATDEMIKKWDEWKTNTEGAMAEVGSSSETFTEDIKNDMSDIGDASEDLADEIDTQTSNMITYMGNLVGAIEDWRKKYVDAVDSIIKKNEELALSEGRDTKGKAPAETPPSAETKPDAETPPSADNGGSSAIGSKKFISEPAHYDASGATDNKYPPQPTNGNMYLVDIHEGSRYPYGVAWKKNGARYGWVSSFDTGGYTGDWGPQGKLAMLHEKELVLNKDDTSNLLQTVDFIHKIISMIDSQAHTSSLFNMSAVAGITTGEDTLEQTVTIHAEFPNAIDHNEIEEAFNNLINTASQYANRK